MTSILHAAVVKGYRDGPALATSRRRVLVGTQAELRFALASKVETVVRVPANIAPVISVRDWLSEGRSSADGHLDGSGPELLAALDRYLAEQKEEPASVTIQELFVQFGEPTAWVVVWMSYHETTEPPLGIYGPFDAESDATTARDALTGGGFEGQFQVQPLRKVVAGPWSLAI
jgi:hypothetical protein